MSLKNYFTLTLDTTPPEISIYAPKYTDRITVDEIRIESNEDLLEYQNIYIIDSENKRHDVIFARISNTEYLGKLTFSGYPYGLTTIFAQMQDTVGNMSRLIMCSINIISAFDSKLMRLSMSEKQVNPVISDRILTPVISDRTFARVTIKDFD